MVRCMLVKLNGSTEGVQSTKDDLQASGCLTGETHLMQVDLLTDTHTHTHTHTTRKNRARKEIPTDLQRVKDRIRTSLTRLLLSLHKKAVVAP